MITMLEVMMILICALMMNMSNPVKMSITVMALGGTILLMSSKITGATWMNLILFLLFMGGILVVFMIISSVSPNEKPMKIKMLLFVPFLMASAYCALNLTTQSPKASDQVKSVLLDIKFLMGMVLIMSMYFFLFIKILTASEMSLRTFV